MTSGITPDEQLALAVAVEKAVKPIVSDLKDEARDDLRVRYLRDGCDRRPIMVGGIKVGDVGMSYGAPKPAIKAGHEDEALDYLRQVGLVEERPAEGWEARFRRDGNRYVDALTGELVEWLYTEPGTVRAAVHGCKPKDVAEAFGNRIADRSVSALLTGEVG